MPKRRDKNKVKQVAREYIKNGLNMTQALKTVENNKPYIHKNSINVKASRWRLDEELQAEIKREVAKWDKNLISREYIELELYRIINDNIAKHSDRVSALALLAKMRQLTGETAIANVNIVGTDKLKGIIEAQRTDNIAVSPNSNNILPNTTQADTQVIDEKGVAT